MYDSLASLLDAAKLLTDKQKMLSNSRFTTRDVGLLCWPLVGLARTSGAEARVMGVIDPIYFLLISESNNETYLPTFRRSPQAHSWLPSTHGNPRWPRCA